MQEGGIEMSPTQRTLKELRDHGWTAAVVEHWNAHARIRQDLFGIIDVLAVRPGQTLGIQTTTTTNLCARITKALSCKELIAWLEANNRFQVWGWSQKGPRGAKKVWTITVRTIVLYRGQPVVLENEL